MDVKSKFEVYLSRKISSIKNINFGYPWKNLHESWPLTELTADQMLFMPIGHGECLKRNDKDSCILKYVLTRDCFTNSMIIPHHKRQKFLVRLFSWNISSSSLFVMSVIKLFDLNSNLKEAEWSKEENLNFDLKT